MQSLSIFPRRWVPKYIVGINHSILIRRLLNKWTTDCVTSSLRNTKGLISLITVIVVIRVYFDINSGELRYRLTILAPIEERLLSLACILLKVFKSTMISRLCLMEHYLVVMLFKDRFLSYGSRSQSKIASLVVI